MSESPASKSSQALQGEYQQLAFRAGNLQYSIEENKKDLALINSQMRDLALEFISAQAREQKEQAEAAQKASDEAKQAPKKLEAVPAAEPVSGAV